MKFLDSKEIAVENDGVAVIFKPVSVINQAALLGYQNAISKALAADDIGKVSQAKFKTVCYALNEMMNSLSITGKAYDPQVVAASADISDPDTIKVLNIIFNMVVDLLVQGETKKKSSTPQKSTKKESGAKNAPDQTKA